MLHTNGTPVIQSWRWAAAMGLTPDDKLLSRFPYFWSAGLTMTLGGPLAAGATVITVESVRRRGRPRDHGARAGDRAPGRCRRPTTRSSSTPTSARATSRRSPSPSAPSRLSPPFPTGSGEPQANGYGLTETFTLCTWAEPEETGGELRTVHGRALPGIDLRIVDSETGEPLADRRARARSPSRA